MSSTSSKAGLSALLLGLLIALAGSYADNLLGGSSLITALQVALWLAGGLLMLAGAVSTAMLRAKGRDRVDTRRRRSALRASAR